MRTDGLTACSIALFVSLSAHGARPEQSHRIEEAAYIRIGGIEEWVSMRGDDDGRPVLLVVHGGPGDVQSPFVKAYAPYEHDFVLVQWDQRGGGRTYAKYGKETPNLTLTQQIDDGIELSEWLHRRFPKQQLILLGHSWGTIVGTGMVQKKPDLFYAYVGTGQVASWPAIVNHKFDVALRGARSKQDTQTLSMLESIGTPDPANVSQFFVISRAATRTLLPADDAAWFAATPQNLAESPGFSEKEIKAYSEGLNYSVSTLMPTLIQVDLTRSAPSVNVPYCVIQGTDDINVSPEAAKVYFDSITAPKKHFYFMNGAGHFALATHQPEFLADLKDCLRN